MNETLSGAGETVGLSAVLVMVGTFLKQIPGFPDKWIPTALALIGCGIALAVNGLTLASGVSGLSAGLAAVGANQLYRQHTAEPPKTP